MGRSYIVIRTSFEAIHAWTECPWTDVSFLKNCHRHIFHVEMKIETFADRGIEFIRYKRSLDSYIKGEYGGKDIGSTSCEMIAKTLAEVFKASEVEVSEDLENSAIYEA